MSDPLPSSRAASLAGALGLPFGLLTLSFALACALSLVLAPAASAHAELVSISPSDGARVALPPDEVVLTFTEEIATALSVVEVVDGEGLEVQDGEPVVQGPVLTQALAPGLSMGSYQVAYKVVSADGHAVSGTSTFTATRGAETLPPTTSSPDPPSPSTSRPSSDTASATAPDSSDSSTTGSTGTAVASPVGSESGGGRGSWLWFAVATAAALGVGGFLIARRGGADAAHDRS